jgi:hypothetical protein
MRIKSIDVRRGRFQLEVLSPEEARENFHVTLSTKIDETVVTRAFFVCDKTKAIGDLNDLIIMLVSAVDFLEKGE